jgi:hypothetical protein
MLALIITFSIVFGGFIGYLMKVPKYEDMKSELSDPSINLPPIWYWRPHQQILEVLYKNDPYEISRKQINIVLGKSKNHAYERQLFLWWYVHRRVEKTGYGKTHYYTLTKKGKDAMIRFCDRF